MTGDALLPPEVLSRWRDLVMEPTPFGTGLINATFAGRRGDQDVILQRLHPVFAATVHFDIDAVTAHLAAIGLPTPRLLRTDDGALWAESTAHQVWRLQTRIPASFTVDTVDSTARAAAAGVLVAQFHRAVDTLHHTYRHVRAGVHDTAHHLATLQRALDAHGGHRLFADVQQLAIQVVERLDARPDFSLLPLRHSHGDLKISNLLFDAQGRGICLIDLDTLAKMAWPFEMGDALRSWCNPQGEDVAAPTFDVARFAAAVSGYRSTVGDLISPAEWDVLVDGVETICLELAARFLADALNESYFGWNAQRFDSRGAHNLARAHGQAALARSIDGQRAQLVKAIRAA